MSTPFPSPPIPTDKNPLSPEITQSTFMDPVQNKMVWDDPALHKRAMSPDSPSISPVPPSPSPVPNAKAASPPTFSRAPPVSRHGSFPGINYLGFGPLQPNSPTGSRLPSRERRSSHSSYDPSSGFAYPIYGPGLYNDPHDSYRSPRRATPPKHFDDALELGAIHDTSSSSIPPYLPGKCPLCHSVPPANAAYQSTRAWRRRHSTGSSDGKPVVLPPAAQNPSVLEVMQKMNWLAIVKAIAKQFGLMLVKLTICYCYTMAGGVIIFALDKSTEQAMCDNAAQSLIDLKFTDEQLAFISSSCSMPSCPPDKINVLAAQFFATTLVTTIGYGNRSVYSTGGRWFAFFFSVCGIVLVVFLLMEIGTHLMRITQGLMLLFVDIFLPVEYQPGPGLIMPREAVRMFSAMDNDGKIYLWDLRDIMDAVDGEEFPPPKWDEVCDIAVSADLDGSGDIDASELPLLLEKYAVHLCQKRQNEYYSVLVFVFACLLIWMLGGMVFYAKDCASIGSFGKAFYFVYITLTTIGTGDVWPNEDYCMAFWWFQTCLGFGFATVFVGVFAHHLISFSKEAAHKKVELDTKFTWVINWGVVGDVGHRFRTPLVAIGGVLLIFCYLTFGAGVMYGYEYDNAKANSDAGIAAYQAQGFNADQDAFLSSCYEVLSTIHWGYGGAFRYCAETIFTIGYGHYAPVTAGGRTFIIMYSFFGLGLVALQLGKLAEALSLVPSLIWDFIAAFILHDKKKGRSWDRKKVHMLTELMDDIPGLLKGRDRLHVDEMRQLILKDHDHLDREMLEQVLVEFDDDGDEVIEGHVASIKIAHIYTREKVHSALWTFGGGLFICGILYAMSVPIFMALEGWSGGDALWFCYITQTTIGLGDFTPLTNGGNVYWFFYALCSVGLLGIWIPSGLCIYSELRRFVLKTLADKGKRL